jgi:EspG family
MTSEQSAVTDITVNLEALWLLQALLGIPRLASELRVRPYGQPRSTEWVTQHPGLGVLVGQGICDDAGVVRADIAERMAALAAPDVEVVILVSRGRLNWSNQVVLDDPATWRAIPDGQLRIVLARRDGRWTSAVRTGDVITIDDCEALDSERLEALVCQALDSVHHVEPARITAVNIPLDSMLGAVADHAHAGSMAAKQAALRAAGLRGAALVELASALEDPQAEAVLYARAYVDAETSLSASVLNLRDTASGRVALYRLNPPHGSLQEWMAIAPATPAQVHHAVGTVLGSVTVRSWDAHERMST